MARLARLVVPHQPHLVTQSAVAGRTPLDDPAECAHFLAALQRAAAERGVAVHGYVLLPDAFMLLCTPADPDALGRMMQALSRWFAAGHNRRRGQAGPLWRSRFVAAPLAAEHVVDTLRYIEQSPVRHGLVGHPLEHEASSAHFHASGRRDPVLSPAPALWTLGNTPFEREAAHGRLLATPLPAARQRQFDDTLARGWPLAAPSVLAQWEAAQGRRTVRLPRGRPKAN